MKDKYAELKVPLTNFDPGFGWLCSDWVWGKG